MKNFLIGLGLNMVLRWEWVLLAAIAFGLHLWLKIPVLITYIILGVWFAGSLAVTVIMMIASRTDYSKLDQPTKNPYAKKTTDFYRDGRFVGKGAKQ